MNIALTALPVGIGTWACCPPLPPPTLRECERSPYYAIMQGAVAIVHTWASWPTVGSSLLFSPWTGCFAHSATGKHVQRELPDTLITIFVFISLEFW